MNRLQEVAAEIDFALSKLQKCFVSGMKLTFIARDPNNDETALIKTNDDLNGVARVVGIYAEREKQNDDRVQ